MKIITANLLLLLKMKVFLLEKEILTASYFFLFKKRKLGIFLYKIIIINLFNTFFSFSC